MMNPWDGLAADYDSHFKDRLCRAEDYWITETILNLSAKSVLDLCCGPATWLRRIHALSGGRRPKVYLGIDSSQAMVYEALEVIESLSAPRKCLHRVFRHDVHDLHTLHWATQAIKFDLALCLLGSTSYLSNPSQVVSGTAQRLKVGGIAMFGFFGPAMREHPSLGRSVKNKWVPALHKSLRPRFYTLDQILQFFDPNRWRLQLYGLTGSATRAAARLGLGDVDLELTVAIEAPTITRDNANDFCYLIVQGTRI